MSEFNPVKYRNEFTKLNYDRLNIQVPKGQKEVIETHLKTKGYKSINSYVNDLINADIEAGENKGIHVHDNNGKVVVGDINGDVNM